jgi:hypothetical protein
VYEYIIYGNEGPFQRTLHRTEKNGPDTRVTLFDKIHLGSSHLVDG